MAKVIDPAVSDVYRSERGRPLPVPELLEVDVSASRGREQQRGIQTRREGFQGVEDALAQRDAPSLPARLRARLQATLRVDPLNGDHAGFAVAVPALERNPFLRPSPVPAANAGITANRGSSSAAIASPSRPGADACRFRRPSGRPGSGRRAGP
jgi:hypothetical protein